MPQFEGGSCWTDSAATGRPGQGLGAVRSFQIRDGRLVELAIGAGRSAFRLDPSPNAGDVWQENPESGTTLGMLLASNPTAVQLGELRDK